MPDPSLHARPRHYAWILVAVLGAGVGIGCGNLTEVASADTAGPCGAACLAADASVDGKAGASSDAGVKADTAPEAPDAFATNPLCGTGECDPDNDLPCDEVDAGEAPDAATNLPDAEPSSDAGSASDADGGSGNMGGSFGPSNSGGSDEPAPAQSYACRVTRDGTSRKSTCELGGAGKHLAPCNAPADCAPGYTCVGESIGVCLKYCCKGTETICSTGTYCDDTQLTRGDNLQVPVCVPAQNCDPLATPGTDPHACPDGRTCTIVRLDGTTGCVVDPKCPQGFVYADSTKSCLSLCHTSSSQAANECHGGVCQAGSANLPEGMGICVGTQDQ